jgi:hypothetical protein
MKTILFFVFISVFRMISFSQAVGYQGKKLIAEIGYIPANNVSAILLDYNLADDYYSNDFENPGARDPVIFKHLLKFEIEYAAFRYGSLFFRYNPFTINSNVEYYDQATGLRVDYVSAESKGGMISLGYRKYTNGNLAPLGSYWGLYGTQYSFESRFTDSKFAEEKTPEVFLEYPSSKNHLFGLFGQIGVKNIFWDKVILDIQIDAGYFFGQGEDYYSEGGIDEFAPYDLSSSSDIMYYTVYNTKAFFFLTPSINVGYLIF